MFLFHQPFNRLLLFFWQISQHTQLLILPAFDKWLLLISCPGIRKCLSRFKFRISFCLHLDFGSNTNFSLATSTAVEKLFPTSLDTIYIYIYTYIQSSALSLSFFFVYPTMPPAASSFTAASITMAALYITCDRPTAVELPWNLNTFTTTSSFSGWLPWQQSKRKLPVLTKRSMLCANSLSHYRMFFCHTSAHSKLLFIRLSESFLITTCRISDSLQCGSFWH